MGVLDLDRLLREISPGAPSGDNLEYDPVFGQMERAAEGRPEKEIGETFVEATEADWNEVKSRAVDVLSRSHDLRAAIYLARAALHTDGFLGFSDGLAIVREYVDRFWESLHPQLDPDDDNDPTMRINALRVRETAPDFFDWPIPARAACHSVGFHWPSPSVSAVFSRESIRDSRRSASDLPSTVICSRTRIGGSAARMTRSCPRAGSSAGRASPVVRSMIKITQQRRMGALFTGDGDVLANLKWFHLDAEGAFSHQSALNHVAGRQNRHQSAKSLFY